MKQLSTITGRIERRLLVNLRVDPEAVARVLPEPFEPLTVDGWAVAGVCLIRLRQLRPPGLPPLLGLTTENAAHRFAVTWDHAGHPHTGVWIPERHTASRLTATLGERLFPAVHAHASFAVRDTPDELAITIADRTGPLASVRCGPGRNLDSVFATRDEAERFFRTGCVGISPAGDRTRCDAVELTTTFATLEQVQLIDASSRILDRLLPDGCEAEWDSAFVMRDVLCQWNRTDAPVLGRHVQPVSV